MSKSLEKFDESIKDVPATHFCKLPHNCQLPIFVITSADSFSKEAELKAKEKKCSVDLYG